MKAKDIMSREVITVTKDVTIQETAKLLTEHQISGLPVLEGKKVIGMVTEGDLIFQDRKLDPPAFIELLGGVIFLKDPNKYLEGFRKMIATRVEDMMTTKVISVREDTPIEEIAAIMTEKRINRIPVLDEKGELVGIVSRQDLVKSLIKE
jgi:CBS domain-containing protein